MRWNPNDPENMRAYRAKTIASRDRTEAAMVAAKADVERYQNDLNVAFTKRHHAANGVAPQLVYFERDSLSSDKRKAFDAAQVEMKIADGLLTAAKDRLQRLKTHHVQFASDIAELDQDLRTLARIEADFEALLEGPQEVAEPRKNIIQQVRAKVFADGTVRSPEKQAAMDAYNEDRRAKDARASGGGGWVRG